MASSFSVEFTLAARQDLRTISRYIAEKLNNPKAASELSDRITSSAISLSTFPKRYRVRRKDSKGCELRYMTVKNFVLIYTVYDSASVVSIVRIAYGRRDIASML
ncbi:MAG: type II toxin-antitoxin system RelE/ParE family toxin [Synergistaceae bacterium]|nr:type II toxin-antitoxin system RelE/ParE family toxin [Synergistaceae bacterium]